MIVNNNKLKNLLGMAALALPLLLASCSSDESGEGIAPAPGTLTVRVAPKAEFVNTGAPATRSSVDADGKFSWTSGDHIYLGLSDPLHAGNVLSSYTLVYDGTAWKTHEGLLPSDNNGTSATQTVLALPAGFTAVKLTAVYTNCKTTIADNTMSFACDTYGAGDVMTYTTESASNEVTIAFKHQMARFVFTGLSSGETYKLAGAYTVTGMSTTAFTLLTSEAGATAFTPDAAGNLIAYTADKDVFTGEMKLTATSNGATAFTSALTGSLTAGAGKTYTMIAATPGKYNPDNGDEWAAPLYEGKQPILLSVPGGTPYWVAPEDAAKQVEWSDNLDDWCPTGWHVPTKDEFVAMTGLPADDVFYEKNNAAIKAAFPGGSHYWSSTGNDEYTDEAWDLHVALGDNAEITYEFKSYIREVRCVRAKY